MRYPEDFLHYLWQFKLFDLDSLQTVDAMPIQILKAGLPNKDSGPDFLNSKLHIGDTIWVGQVEIHLKSSDWLLHKHQLDAGYNNVILHVVFEHDKDVHTQEGRLLPTLELKGRIPDKLATNYQNLLRNNNYFPCEKQIASIDTFVVDGFLSRVLVERYLQKSNELFDTLRQLNGNWDETFYHYIAKNFGFKVNALPMQMLAQRIPQQWFAKLKNNSLQIEALLFGQAGMLSGNFDEDYPKTLQNEYRYLQKKHQLVALEPGLWKFLRMRPQNFPSLRLAQFAALIVKSNHLFSKVLELESSAELKNLFVDLPVHPFWSNHYHFHKTSANKSSQLGKSSIDNILINTVVLFLFAYAQYTSQEEYQHRAFRLLEHISAEQNSLLAHYADAGLKIENAYQSQAILELHKYYCLPKRCLSCGIGLKILTQ